MAKYPAVITTMAGTNTIAEANASKQALIFTKIVIGAGDMPASIPQAIALTDKRLELDITKSVKTGDGQFMVQGLLSNKTLAAGFYAREIGLMAKAGENGREVLFSYTNGGNYVDYIPDKNTPMDSYTFTITTVIGNAEKVQAVISDNGLASIHDLKALESEISKHKTDEHAHDNRFKALEKTTQSLTSTLNDTRNKKYDKSGGELSGDIILTGDSKIKTDDSGLALTILGASEESNGAYIQLNGNGYPDNSNGEFCIVSSANGVKREFVGNIDGTLKWGGDDIIRQSMLATSDNASALSQAPTLQLVKSLLESNLKDIAVIEMREYK
ncbi:hypothetical protein HMPREF0872_03390 [Veillonella montpellierensis DNF00314]|uniref:Tail fiber protein n=1 Tax=Veillonella montpellierensis DNF00314 TaxID=1401067 RepID=A0A096CR03_9FIRM|nr:phage tail protein [Veillonella montpellierensis]KGF47759.1 hypothetical protein HMPREF0872_03390 [Veillonella montpellierensis DNF00314]